MFKFLTRLFRKKEEPPERFKYVKVCGAQASQIDSSVRMGTVVDKRITHRWTNDGEECFVVLFDDGGREMYPRNDCFMMDGVWWYRD